MTKFLLLLIRLYQVTLSPLLGRSCRFEPSCSRYTSSCIELHGPARGLWLGLRRLGRCHPFHAGGFDPPPPRSSSLTRGETARVDEPAPDVELAAGKPRFYARARKLRARGVFARARRNRAPGPESSCNTECRAQGCSR